MPRSSALAGALLASLASAPALASAMSRFYDSIAIVRPGKEATVFDNSGKLEVAVALSPALRAGDRIAVDLDGRLAQQSEATRFELSGVERGEHALQARVLDRDGKLLISSAPVKFSLWHASRLFRVPASRP